MQIPKDKIREISRLIHSKRSTEERDTNWPFLPVGRPASMRQANKFMLGAIIDYQIPANQAWENAKRFSQSYLGNPPDLFRTIEQNWTERKWNSNSTWREINLHHRFPAAHRRVRQIGVDIVRDYDGDARNIWLHQDPPEVLRRLQKLGTNGVGSQISAMIVGALLDTRQIKGEGDFKADTHLCRVVGRLIDGEKVSPSRALAIGELLAGSNSWAMDGVLFFHGKTTCRARTPKCRECFLNSHCEYSRS